MTENPTTFAHAFRVLAALFYRSPRDAGMDSLITYLSGNQLAEEWPWGTPETLRHIAGDFAAGAASPTLAAEHQRLFIGPDALPAPPLGIGLPGSGKLSLRGKQRRTRRLLPGARHRIRQRTT